MGKQGAVLLLDLINGKSPPRESLKPLKVQLVIRESAGPVPQSHDPHQSIRRPG
jgi:DNA-binding LacI/PurR family transcriptional regulator